MTRFLDVKVRSLLARARRLSRFTMESVGIRARDLPYAPSRAHFAAAAQRLAEIDQTLQRHLAHLGDAGGATAGRDPDDLLHRAALAEREIDRARRAFALFFDLFSQRGTSFAPALAACDEIAADCYRVVREGAPGLLPERLLQPLTYLEHSVSPATYRRGVMLQRLLGERNPFPLVRVPHEQVGSPWGMGVLLHEVGHNLQSDLGIWHENAAALLHRVLGVTRSAVLARVWARWHKEIFADLLALLLGGPAACRSMMEFLSHPGSRTLTFHPLSVHPTAYVRGHLLVEMLRRMGFADDAAAAERVWRGLYARDLPGRMPRALLATAPALIPHVVDEVAFQPRRGLGLRALADVVRFTPRDEAAVRRGAVSVARGRVPADLPARLAVSASRYAFEHRMADAPALARAVLHDLSLRGARARSDAPTTTSAAA